MYEIGAELNTEFQASDEDFMFQGKTPNSNSYDIMARLRVGTDRIKLSIGTETWISKIFEEDNFNMTALYFGLNFNF